MTQVSKELVLELQKIIREDYNKKLSVAKVEGMANNLVSFYDLLSKIDARGKMSENVGKSQKRNSLKIVENRGKSRKMVENGGFLNQKYRKISEKPRR